MKGVIMRVHPEFKRYIKEEVIPQIRYINEKANARIPESDVSATNFITIKRKIKPKEKGKQFDDIMDIFQI